MKCINAVASITYAADEANSSQWLLANYFHLHELS